VHATETAGKVSYTFKQFLPHHGWRDITIAASHVFGPSGVAELADSGAVVREPKLFLRYVHDALDAWHRSNAMEQLYEQCGWKDQGHAFLVGTRLYDAQGERTVVGSTEVTRRGEWLTPTTNGSARGWTKAANGLFGDGRQAPLFALLCGFAAPLMHWQAAQEGGAVVSLVNRSSGTGKTTTLEAVASIWGDARGLSLTRTDTQVAKGLTLAVLANLPVVFDELALLASSEHPSFLNDFVMMFTNGRDKMRGMQSGQGIAHTQGAWKTLLVTASNASITDLLQSFAGVDAPAFRVLEFKCEFAPHLDYHAGDALKWQLFENAGWAGDAFMRHLLQPVVLDFARKALAQWTAEIWKSTKFRPEHRFWVRTLGAVAVAGELVRSIGLLNCDPAGLVRWALDELGEHAQSATITRPRDEAGQAVAAVEVLGEYLSEHLADTLVVQREWAPGDKTTEPITRPRRNLLVRYELQGGRLVTPLKEFRTWVVRHGYSYRDVLKDLTRAQVLASDRRTVMLGAGTNVASAPTACIEFDMLHPSVSSIARVVKEPAKWINQGAAE
jgi:Domain of unknown function (DUF927)